MALNAWQKITRVLPGKPFGDGKDGNYSSASIPSITCISCSGTSGNKTLAIASAAFSNGDLVLIHQTRGTGAGQWEINRISSGGGTTTLTLQVDKQYTYTDSGNSQAQVIKMPRYENVTVQSGTWAVPSWDGNVGGIFPIVARKTMSVSGIITRNGNNASGATGATDGGFWGGNGIRGYSGTVTAQSGEGTAGARVNTSSANGNGGGGGSGEVSTSIRRSGGGGGHSAKGGNATLGYEGTGTLGAGGNSAGSSDLVTMVFGGGGGGGVSTTDQNGGGGAGGGILIFFTKNFVVNTGASLTVNGGNGVSAGSAANSYRSGGGGAGGSILVVCETASLGSSLIVATGGTGGLGAGNGAAGRISVHHSGTITGTSNPPFANIEDSSLKERSPSGAFFNLIYR